MSDNDFTDDLEELNEAVENALDELGRVKARTLKAEELADFKAAQYALRNISEEYEGSHDVPELYEANLTVSGNERELYEKR